MRDKAYWKKSNKGLSTLITLLGSLSLLTGCGGVDPELNASARARFDEILGVMPELDSITCFNNDCTSVVYFNFNKEPEETFDVIMRGNTATFSNWKLNETGTSYVTIFATLNGETVMKCDGKKGAVDSCS